ncbi:MAG: class I SAM-dependent RNA methyltransferase, partial [Bacteroidota bacterium]
LISSNLEALKKIGLRPSRKIQLYNGKLECKFLKFELYAGSRKHQKTT